jgi:hypothetical protein
VSDAVDDELGTALADDALNDDLLEHAESKREDAASAATVATTPRLRRGRATSVVGVFMQAVLG